MPACCSPAGMTSSSIRPCGGNSFTKAIWIDRPGWYDVTVRSVGYGQEMRLIVYPVITEILDIPADADTLYHSIPAGGQWKEESWGS